MKLVTSVQRVLSAVDLLGLGMVQTSPVIRDVDENLGRMLEILDGLPPCHMVVLPELWSCGCCYDSMGEAAVKSQACLERMQAVCESRRCWMVCGTLPWTDGGPMYNRSFLIDSCGGVYGFYDKVHLYSRAGEDRVFVPGSVPLIADVMGVTIAVTVCYDLRFPDYYSKLALYGVEIVINPAMWPSSRIGDWIILSRARGMDNQMFVAGVNICGISGGVEYGGSSVVVDPWGAVVADVGCHECAQVVEIKPWQTEKVRRASGRLASRRTDMYGYPEEPVC